MKNSKEFKTKRKQLLTYLNQMDETIVDFVGVLKKQSSEELLSGSASVAKKYLEEIIMLESSTSDFSRLIKNIVNLIQNTGDIEPDKKVSSDMIYIEDPIEEKVVKTEDLIKEQVEIIEEPIEEKVEKMEDQVEKIVEEQVEKPKKSKKNNDAKIPILKSLIYLGGIANEEEINKYMMQYSGRNGDENISIDELRISLDSMIETEMISVDPLDENIEILQSGIDYLAKNEA